ncbi:hypothetical protein GYN67_02800 [Lactococcus piscium]|uniref:DUF6273 domain-containing protein n=1 Tax=Pseudolactococcus carnosus TaxID=2749961 RepID=UPI001FBA89F0|nr:DUF6273 domain-containing protein [Lactococcus carnosus]MCJ1995624.1 hypothetical protein [Lactococcus carnosus]
MKRLKISKNGVKQAFKVFASLTVIWGVYALVQLNRQVTVKDIAFDNILSIINKLDGYTVYLKEKGGYEPYLVLSKNYSSYGNVLLLRKYLLDEERIFNEAEGYGAYYEDSKIDSYLNTEFRQTLSPLVQKQLVTSQLEITALSSVGSVGDDTISIPRQVFLLSHRELGNPKAAAAAKEGKGLLYAFVPGSSVAMTKGGEARPYWVRTPYTEHDTTIWFMSAIGSEHHIPLWDMLTKDVAVRSVRPAFCIKKDTKLERKEGIVPGKAVFVLKEDAKSKGGKR